MICNISQSSQPLTCDLVSIKINLLKIFEVLNRISQSFQSLISDLVVTKTKDL